MNISNKVKFAMLLSITSLMGFQASAYTISCPAADTLKNKDGKVDVSINYVDNGHTKKLEFTFSGPGKAPTWKRAEFSTFGAEPSNVKKTNYAVVCTYTLDNDPYNALALSAY